MAYSEGDNLVYLDTEGEEGEPASGSMSEVDDETVSTSTTWSSAKLKALFEQLGIVFE